MKLLLTGFEPFGTLKTNVSWEAAKRIALQPWEDVEVVARQLPVSFDRGWKTLRTELERGGYDVVVMLGVAASREAVCLERVAINIDDTSSSDNDGESRRDAVIAPDGPAAYFTTLPIRKMLDAVCGAGFMAKVSNTAGAYVCNHVFYKALHWASDKDKAPMVGFIHLPDEHEDDGMSALCESVRIALTAACAEAILSDTRDT